VVPTIKRLEVTPLVKVYQAAIIHNGEEILKNYFFFRHLKIGFHRKVTPDKKNHRTIVTGTKVTPDKVPLEENPPDNHYPF